ncbi:diacylglycerol lipase-alpha-like isoform X3 [Biomphalaria glabrata]|uniref:sn-1-specific diacylglycerol lipase n=1 Tax=Biomphalaria glabrata TaxID=6526 RepID=A0A9W3ALU6_BIOGL|nr:diacylglycerol lipase-alpha-like isoform X3 [Biomphalaria glabrata]
MPGVVVFGRRWSIGSDDLVVPMIFMIVVHSAWLMALGIVRGIVDFTSPEECTVNLRDLILGYIIIVSFCIILEVCIAFVSTRGSILTQTPRASIEYLLYGRYVVGLVELAWLILGAVWASKHYTTCSPDSAKKTLLGVMICDWLLILLLVISMWCSFDSAGRKWVKMKKFQDSMKERRNTDRRRGQNKRQSGSRRNWRQRKAFRAYEESWDRRLQLLCCCVERKAATKNSMSEIASLFTDFFRDLDVVPSDIIAGLVLLRKHQQQRMNSIISQGDNDVYQFLSGVPINPQTKFLQLSQPDVMENFQKVIHYMRFALAVYGWPIFVKMHPATWCCRLMPLLGCCCCKKAPKAEIVDDNCCMCNFSTAKSTSGLENLDVVYCTYHVAIGETPFFVALDHENKKVVVAIRGTLSLQDVLTDLQAEPETLPLASPKDDWQGHKGMIQAAVYIKKKLVEDGILQLAWERDEALTKSSDWLRAERDTSKYDLVLVGHSLGAGTAAILAILLHADYPNLHCYAYSPPGGLLTLPCVEETKSFITSVVVGKDCVPRIGLPQLEMLRADILNQIKNSSESKWKIITEGLMCCKQHSESSTTKEMLSRDVTAHPSNSAIGLSAHLPLYPPGQMIHVVRSHLTDKKTRGFCDDSNFIYQAIWANNGDFDEVLVSPTMLNDHMADRVLEALEKVVLKVAPEKPVHTLTEEERREMLNHPSVSSLATPSDILLSNAINSSDIQNTRGSEDSNLNGEVFLEEVDDSILFGLPKSDTEELVRAPLASPETLSMASGVAVFSPSSSIIGKDNLKHALHKCAEKSLSNTNEAILENEFNVNQRAQRSVSQRGNSSPLARLAKKTSSESNSQDSQTSSCNEPDAYHVKLRSGNTISVKAEVVNEMIRQNSKSPSPSRAVVDNSKSSAVLEPSSHTHFVSPSHSKLITSDMSQQSSSLELDAVEPTNHKPNTIHFITGSENHEENRKDNVVSNDVYSRHSPSESNQHEYGHPNVYYSQAGIGYPHNAFHLPLRFNSFPLENNLHAEGESVDSDSRPLINHQGNEDEGNDIANGQVKGQSAQKRPFMHAESESSLLSKNKLVPRMRRSAEQGDIANLCDALEVFESEEDKSRLFYSSLALQEETPEEVLSAEKDEVPVSLLHPPALKQGKVNKQSVSFGDSVVISSGNEDGYSLSDTDSKELSSPSADGDSHSLSRHSPVFKNPSKETLNNSAQFDVASMNFLDNQSLSLQETHL